MNPYVDQATAESLIKIASNAADSLKSFLDIEEEELDEAMMVMAMLGDNNNNLHESDAQAILKWAHGVQSEANLLRMVLVGAIEILVVDGAISIRAASTPGSDAPHLMIERLIACGDAEAAD